MSLSRALDLLAVGAGVRARRHKQLGADIMGKRIELRGLIAAIAAATIVAPARADVCDEYHVAMAFETAALSVARESRGAKGSPKSKAMLKLVSDASNRLHEARRAVHASVTDASASEAIGSLYAVDDAAWTAWRAHDAWLGDSAHVLTKKIVGVLGAIDEALRTAFNEVCERKK